MLLIVVPFQSVQLWAAGSATDWEAEIEKAATPSDLAALWGRIPTGEKKKHEAAKDRRKAALTAGATI